MNPNNIQHLGDNDVVLVGYPGSGAAWLGCLLIRLGIFYMDGYHELFCDSASQQTTILPVSRRDRLPDYRDRDRIISSYAEPIRVTKTHLEAKAFGPGPRFRVLVLVRDGRDAIISYYHWLCSFGGLTKSLSDFIRTGTQAEPVPPAQAWSNFYEDWLKAVNPSQICLVRFEDMRVDTLSELRRLLTFLGVERQEPRLLEAIDECSYSAMRSKEENAVKLADPTLGPGMIMRRGQVGEWREALTAEEIDLAESQCGGTLRKLGY